MLAHYHEAAYDAYMTGYAFVNIIKFKEFEQPKEETKNNNKKGQYQPRNQQRKDHKSNIVGAS